MLLGRESEKRARQEALRREIEGLIQNCEGVFRDGELRQKVIALIPAFQEQGKLLKPLTPSQVATAARDRILFYFRKYPGVGIHRNELLVISGIQGYTRRLSELQMWFGWKIASGVTIRQMIEYEYEGFSEELKRMKPSEYVLLDEEQDRDAPHRWNIARDIRKEDGSVRDKILKFLLANVGKEITNEELRYVAKNKTEWARRVRELRTEFGWPVVTRATGRPDLKIGTYVLESDRQSPEHDRDIPDQTRREVLRRDGYKCVACGWSHDEWNPSDPRHLELHHVQHHARGGENSEENLQTLCTVCHDAIHRQER